MGGKRSFAAKGLKDRFGAFMLVSEVVAAQIGSRKAKSGPERCGTESTVLRADIPDKKTLEFRVSRR